MSNFTGALAQIEKRLRRWLLCDYTGAEFHALIFIFCTLRGVVRLNSGII